MHYAANKSRMQVLRNYVLGLARKTRTANGPTPTNAPPLQSLVTSVFKHLRLCLRLLYVVPRRRRGKKNFEIFFGWPLSWISRIRAAGRAVEYNSATESRCLGAPALEQLASRSGPASELRKLFFLPACRPHATASEPRPCLRRRQRHIFRCLAVVQLHPGLSSVRTCSAGSHRTSHHQGATSCTSAPSRRRCLSTCVCVFVCFAWFLGGVFFLFSSIRL
jgi:hypothetical protein